MAVSPETTHYQYEQDRTHVVAVAASAGYRCIVSSATLSIEKSYSHEPSVGVSEQYVLVFDRYLLEIVTRRFDAITIPS